MQETLWENFKKAIEGDVISLVQLILFLILFRDRLGGHSLARDIGKLLGLVQNMNMNINSNSSNKDIADIQSRVKSIEDKIDRRDQRGPTS